ncbi:hypothetical protein EVAR_71248_1 [Eumeta japonica]|uniref:Mariner Mos1 transposase n=1 Tax=Eumeta variegata TaxID=151549 RepID=A0A4C2A7Q4_EUMVA|nr:hypothetical protein EVAR_71248_1 [Eumeta japonica]
MKFVKVDPQLRSLRKIWLLSGDETWIYCYMPERKQQSSVWVYEGDSKPTKLRQARSVGKENDCVFLLHDESCLHDPT